MLDSVEIKPVTNEDFQFGYDIKKETLKEYIEKTWAKWDDEKQMEYYRNSFEVDNNFIVKFFENKIGWLNIIETESNIDINQIFILPKYQNKGIGGKIIKDIMDKGINNNKVLNLQVLKCNKKAQKLYEKLGFMFDDETETHYLYKYEKHIK